MGSKWQACGMRTILWVIAGLIALAPAPRPAMAIRIVTYNLLNYSGGRASEYKTVLNEVQPDVIIVQEMLAGYQTSFLNNVLNAPDGPGGYAMATFTPGGGLENALYYRAGTITYAGSADHIDLATSPRPTDRWRLGLVGYSSDESKFYVYSMHLKASQGYESQRFAAAQIIRANANAFPEGTHFMYGGDFNLYTSTEPAYQEFIGSQADNDGRGFDPINQPAAWHDHPASAPIHTQSTNRDNPDPPSGASTGGLDDRFDFLLVSAAMLDSDGLSTVADTYKAYGNDGNHLNDDINDNPMIPEGWVIADALHGASDHLPVLMDVQAPAEIAYIPASVFGDVIVGAVAEEELTVTNSGDLALFGYIDALEYDFVAPAGYSAPAGTFVDEAGGGGSPHTITMLTGTSGDRNAVLEVHNNSPDMPVRYVSMMGSVKDHAVPSTDPGTQILSADLDFGTHGVGGFSDQTAEVHNVGYNPLQSLLEVHDHNLSGDARFSVPGFAPAGATDLPAQFVVHFDDTGAPPGPYAATLEFLTRDDTSLPGWTGQPAVTFNLAATVDVGTPKGDLDRSGVVDIPDIPLFVTLLLDPAVATPEDREIADMNSDQANDGRDIQLFVGALTP
jgi:endonuclease/exonuclease/phosphatase family metal-dependent hydrolase